MGKGSHGVPSEIFLRRFDKCRHEDQKLGVGRGRTRTRGGDKKCRVKPHVIKQGQTINREFFGQTRPKKRDWRGSVVSRHDCPRMLSLRLPSQGVHSIISCPRSTINPLSMRRLLTLYHVRNAKPPTCARSQFSKVTCCS